LSSALDLRTIVVDTSGEIAGTGETKHAGIGRARRMPVKSRDKQYQVLLEAVQNQSAQVVIVDEIGSKEEVHTAQTISQRGVALVATAHGRNLHDLMHNPDLRPLLGSTQQVILSAGERAAEKSQSKSKTERTGTPTFSIIVELVERRKWHIHWDSGRTVDRILASTGYEYEVRWESNGSFYSRQEVGGPAKEAKMEWRSVLGMLYSS